MGELAIILLYYNSAGGVDAVARGHVQIFLFFRYEMAQFQGQEIIEIVRGGSCLRIAPQAGGRLLSWQLHGSPIIRWPDAADWSHPALVRGGNPLLFPFIARHRVDGHIGLWRDAQGLIEVPIHGLAFAAKPTRSMRAPYDLQSETHLTTSHVALHHG
ncbi:hypothetical protein NH14_006655 [Paraburkholderia sacchari]|uniref:Uncharacterized protein n=1 Tax=Paraburkholderia sacchari TaxID=159450 RepID=A0A8T6Z829_9BURK|nr:hypothetical protein [Paraburkholderia sacchari]